MKKGILITTLIMIFLACNKDEINSDPLFYIDGELLPYFESFVSEGELRGAVIDLSTLHVEGYLARLSQGVVGECRFSADKPNTVTVDLFYWNRATQLEKEYVVFHELGHCILGRLHNDELQIDGTCTSIMESGNGICKENYSIHTRSDYLDELFLE